MAFLDKINQVAKNIGDKAGDAVETTKLTVKIKNEQGAAAEDFKKIGEYYYNLFAAGTAVAPEVVELCNSAKAHFDAAAEAQAAIDGIKAENETAAPVKAAGACPSCGKVNAPGTKFCAECGQKLEG